MAKILHSIGPRYWNSADILRRNLSSDGKYSSQLSRTYSTQGNTTTLEKISEILHNSSPLPYDKESSELSEELHPVWLRQHHARDRVRRQVEELEVEEVEWIEKRSCKLLLTPVIVLTQISSQECKNLCQEVSKKLIFFGSKNVFHFLLPLCIT